MTGLSRNFATTGLNSGKVELGGMVGRVLTTLGIFPNLKGHSVLRAAILLQIDGFIEGNDNKKLYERLATKIQRDVKSLQGNMRNALKQAANSGMLVRMNDLLGVEIISQDCPLPTLQFVALLAHYFIYQCEYFQAKDGLRTAQAQ